MGRLEEPLESNDIKKRRDKMRGLHLTLMTRLREAASHAFNLENMFRNDIEVPNIQSLTASLASISSKKSVLEQMLSNDDGTNCLEGFEGGVARLRELKLRGSAFGGEFEMGRLLEMMENERRARDRPCSACQAAPLLKAVRFDPVRPGSQKSIMLSGKWVSLTTRLVRPLLLHELLLQRVQALPLERRDGPAGFDSKQNCHIL